MLSCYEAALRGDWSAATLHQVAGPRSPVTYRQAAEPTGALLQAGVISQQTFNESVALADVPQSWADLEGVGMVDTRDVGIARGNN